MIAWWVTTRSRSPSRTPRTADAIAGALDALAGRRLAVLTGAGVSTDSGIPDYRGKGAPVRTPMTVEQFLASEDARRRYWVGSHLGWRAFAAAAPNPGHLRSARRSSPAASHPASSRRTSTACTCGPAAAASSNCTAPCAASSAPTAGRSSTGATSPRASRPTTPGSACPRTSPLGPDGDVLPESTNGFRDPVVHGVRRDAEARRRVLRRVHPRREVPRGGAARPRQRCARDRGLVARRELRHPPPRARPTPAASRS